ncbi:hypothetical protein GW17_00053308 [Ensete ventricosum]|nr:hypothetical protein GW17_00053308 [Ensete ventricosum]
MHLRFPNSGIRAKVFIRKIGFKLRVMRLNRVESFYVLLLHFRSKGSEERGWPVTARPPAGAASHGLATPPAYRGAAPVEVPPAGVELAAGVAAPWSGDYRWARQPPPAQGQRRRTSVFLVYMPVLVVIYNYMERCCGSVEVIAGPTMS